MNKPALSATLLSTLWILTVLGAVGQIFFEGQGWDFLVGLSGFVFILGLIWILSRTKPFVVELPDMPTASKLGFWARILLLFLGLGFAFFLGLMITPGLSMMLVCAVLGLYVTWNWRTMVTGKMVAIGLVAGLIPALGAAFLAHGDTGWAAVYLITIPPAFMGGALLLVRTQLGRVSLLEGKPARGLKGFLFGCVFALPASLLNLLGNLQAQDTWIVHGWQSLYAIVPAIAEETWARLFLVTFCYAIVRPTANTRPRMAIGIAILVSVLAHGFSHTGIDPFGIIFGSLLYSLPVALLMIKKDFEHAIGYHFMVDFVRYVAAFLS